MAILQAAVLWMLHTIGQLCRLLLVALRALGPLRACRLLGCVCAVVATAAQPHGCSQLQDVSFQLVLLHRMPCVWQLAAILRAWPPLQRPGQDHAH